MFLCLGGRGKWCKKKLFTPVHCAVCCGEPTLSQHTHTHTQMSSCTAQSHRQLFSNETLRVKHGQFSFSDSSVVHNKALQSTQMKRKLAQFRLEVATPAVGASFYISRLLLGICPRSLLRLLSSSLSLQGESSAPGNTSVFALMCPFGIWFSDEFKGRMSWIAGTDWYE